MNDIWGFTLFICGYRCQRRLLALRCARSLYSECRPCWYLSDLYACCSFLCTALDHLRLGGPPIDGIFHIFVVFLFRAVPGVDEPLSAAFIVGLWHRFDLLNLSAIFPHFEYFLAYLKIRAKWFHFWHRILLVWFFVLGDQFQNASYSDALLLVTVLNSTQPSSVAKTPSNSISHPCLSASTWATSSNWSPSPSSPQPLPSDSADDAPRRWFYTRCSKSSQFWSFESFLKCIWKPCPDSWSGLE